MTPHPITTDRELMSGTPVFTGTRVPIQTLWNYLETGETLDEFLENFPTVPRSQALAVLHLTTELTSRGPVAWAAVVAKDR